jgi:hypothetical protein
MSAVLTPTATQELAVLDCGCARWSNLEQPSVQAELRLAFRARRPLITVFDDNPHSRAHFDYGAAWARHGDIAEFMGKT